MITHRPCSHLSSHDETTIWYRDVNLVDELIGKASFVDVFLRQAFRIELDTSSRTLIDSILVCLMEHGLTPSAISARLIYSSSPENLQAGVAAGLLAVASKFVGTMEPCAALLERIAASSDPELEARRIADDYRARREPVPGFGHHLHKPDDPRSIALIALARDLGKAGVHIQALDQLTAAIDLAAGRHITINASGAIAAILGDLGIAPRMMRGFAVLGRCAGLIAHIAEEQIDPTDRFIWALLDEEISVHRAPSERRS